MSEIDPGKSRIENDQVNLSESNHSASLKLQTNTPHLVSFGRGRLSTTVTLHPIPNGRVLIGSGPENDIVIQGTGVEVIHCIIENKCDIVTLYPKADKTFIDGHKTDSATRLTQGSILTIGRSNYLRFNHPSEAELMKSILPNSRVSMAPINFDMDNNSNARNEPSSDANGKVKKKPPIVPKKLFKEIIANYNQNYDENKYQSSKNFDRISGRIMSKVYKFENLARQQKQEKLTSSMLCPKVFTSDSITMNTPARDVLGKTPPADLKLFAKNLPQSLVNYSESHVTINKLHQAKANNLLDHCNNSSPNIYRKFNSFEKNHVNCIQNSLNQADKENGREEEREQDIEKAKIEEVLHLCAEYEKQNQSEKTINNKHHIPNRIITNGSLPRDQRTSPSPKRELLPISDSDQRDQRSNNCLTLYENLTVAPSNISESPTKMSEVPPSSSYIKYEPVELPNSSCNHSSVNSFGHSPRTRIKTFLSPLVNNNSKSSDSLPERNPMNNLELFEKMFPAEQNGNSAAKKSSIEHDREIVDELRKLRIVAVKQLNKYKRIVDELKFQQQEIISGIEFEKALLVGEYQSSLHELKKEEILRDKIIEKSKRIEKYAESRQKLQLEHQEEYKKTIYKIEATIKSLENELKNIPMSSSNYTVLLNELSSAQEQLENERKNFEDLEFHYLEEEVEWLATREELQRNLNDTNSRIEKWNAEILNIEKEKDDILVSIKDDLCDLHDKLREGRENVIKCEEEIEFLNQQLNCLCSDSEDDFNDDCVSSGDEFDQDRKELFNGVKQTSTPKKTQPVSSQSPAANCLDTENGLSKFPSQDDIDRISKITSNAPIEDGHGSLGKDMLKEIERIRQLHLVEKGSQVIEQERQRVIALKKRVQNEVKAQWAQNRSNDSIFVDESFKK